LRVGGVAAQMQFRLSRRRRLQPVGRNDALLPGSAGRAKSAPHSLACEANVLRLPKLQHGMVEATGVANRS
jgi:hypothetical protein